MQVWCICVISSFWSTCCSSFDFLMAEDLESSIFSSLSTVEVLKRLPVWFGEGVEGLEVNLSVCV